MNIAICDDNETNGNFIADKVKKVNPQCNIFIFTNGLKFLNYKCEWDVVFLDIEMHELNGFSIAKILKKQQRCIFSFVTAHPELAIEGYDYQPFRYILKDAPDEVIERKIFETINEYISRNSKLQISYKGLHKIINVVSISSVEVTGHCLKIKYGNETILWNKTLQEAQKILEKHNFIRCHRSFLVSAKHIKHFTTKQIELDTGEKIPIGRLYQKNAQNEYFKFSTI